MGSPIALFLIALSAVSAATLLFYYATNSRIRRAAIAKERRSGRLELLAGTGILTFAIPVLAALLLGPILSEVLAQPRIVPAAEDAVILTVLLAASLVSMAGAGMHAAGRTIDHATDTSTKPELKRVIRLYHGPLGHYPVHFGWTLAIAALALLSAAHPVPESGALTQLLLAGGAVQGVVRTASVLDGRTWRLILPTDVILCVYVGVRIAAIGTSPIALYFFATLVAGLASLAGWGILHRGFPPTSKPRSARDLITVPEQH